MLLKLMTLFLKQQQRSSFYSIAHIIIISYKSDVSFDAVNLFDQDGLYPIQASIPFKMSWLMGITLTLRSCLNHVIAKHLRGLSVVGGGSERLGQSGSGGT